MLSIIIPIFNEEENIIPLCKKLLSELETLGLNFEIIFINDGSSDETEKILENQSKLDNRLKIINFRKNLGQTAALMAGFDYATGEIIIPMDGDLQNDPKDIKMILEKLNTGYDVVSGWRKDRKDNSIKRVIPSKIANFLISKISGVYLHDYGCSLKAYRKDVLKGVKLYGEMHRFIPIYASWEGAKVTEIPVTHHPRIHGKSKYGFNRIIKVILDLIVVKFLSNYRTKPIYVFGGFGMISIIFSFLVGLWAIWLKILKNIDFISTPLPLLVVMSFITGVMSILMGLLAEISMRTYYETQNKPTYIIKNTLNILNDKY